MSWDVYLTQEDGECPSCGQSTTAVRSNVGNMTFNVAPMYYSAFEFAYKCIHGSPYKPNDDEGFGLRQLTGMKCADALPYMLVAIAHMRQQPSEYMKMNPPNGWGSYESALEFLEELKDASLKHMQATIEVH